MNIPRRVTRLEGRRFGRLLVLTFKGLDRFGRATWACACDCGTSPTVAAANLVNGNTSSCGCYRREHSSAMSRTHGHSHKTPTYRTWTQMKTRCQNPASTGYRYYGGRGVTICERWQSFENFLADMGERPAGMTLDRIDVNGPYSPDNCRWASVATQCQNRRKRRTFEDGLEAAAAFMLSRKVSASDFYAREIRKLAMVQEAA